MFFYRGASGLRVGASYWKLFIFWWGRIWDPVPYWLGFIRKEGTKNRTIEILVDNEYVKKNDDVVQIPLLGKITAGSPIEAIERPNEFFAIPACLIPKNKESNIYYFFEKSRSDLLELDTDDILCELPQDKKDQIKEFQF